MRILYFLEVYWPLVGGRELLVRNLIRDLRKRGHECLVIAGKHKDRLPQEDEYEGVPIHRFPFREVLDSRRIDRFADTAERLAHLQARFAPDLVHLHDFGPVSIFCVRSPRVKPARLLMTLHGCPKDFFWHREFMLSRVLRAADWMTAVSETALVQARALVPDLAGRSSAIRNGLAPPALEPLALPFDPPRVLCIGRLAEEKRFSVAIAAFARLLECWPRAELLMAGDGQVRADLERQVRDLGIERSVRFLGMVAPDDVWHVLNRATLVAMPSRTEGFGLVALEAAIMERPVVASRVAALPEVVADGRTGLLVDLDDVEGLAGAMARLIGKPDLAVALGKAGRRRALEEFNWARSVDQYEALYAHLVRVIPAGPAAAVRP